MISVNVSVNVSIQYTNYWSGNTRTEYDPRKLREYKNWCKEFVGANNWNYYGPYKKTPCEFRFKKPEDALAFKLKFCL